MWKVSDEELQKLKEQVTGTTKVVERIVRTMPLEAEALHNLREALHRLSQRIHALEARPDDSERLRAEHWHEVYMSVLRKAMDSAGATLVGSQLAMIHADARMVADKAYPPPKPTQTPVSEMGAEL